MKHFEVIFIQVKIKNSGRNYEHTEAFMVYGIYYVYGNQFNSIYRFSTSVSRKTFLCHNISYTIFLRVTQEMGAIYFFLLILRLENLIQNSL